MAKDDRLAARRRGQRAETLALIWLSLCGWRLRARDLRTPVGELDLVFTRGSTLLVVEVKHRATRTAAAEAIRPDQQDRIRRATAWFLAGQPQFSHYQVRFDALLVSPGGWPQHIRNAWD
ncbi:MAG: YraN family protein [Alphaproteobacteria bacterium]|nr:YraN family protein [Alphaproteobacteria bacterium]TAD86888.1 MAG: YraN family protein [Alphaproteobacteria bacterium]